MSSSTFLRIAPQVAEYLHRGSPVVALESTIIAHGMPFPQNLETALLLEAEVRSAGAMPATISVWEGHLQVGMSEKQLQRLAKMGSRLPKLSRRDLPMAVHASGFGATTVASTMFIAHLAGISFFATGGIGGVHRGVGQSWDISADLQELARTPVAVVSAGAKAILDLEKTLEYLETMSVPVIGYGTREFPAFFSRKSGIALEYSVDHPAEMADIAATQWQMGMQAGILIANPVDQAYSLSPKIMHEAIDQALAEANQQNVHGKALTPFLLSRVEKLTAGNSLASNVQLARNNARLAAEIAMAYASQQKENT